MGETSAANRARYRQLGTELRWELHVVPGVGHDRRRMSDAAAEYLYGGSGSE